MFPFLRRRPSSKDPIMLLSRWFLITLDDGFFYVETSSLREMGGRTSEGVRGLDVLDIDLVSILGFMGVDFSTGVDPSTSISSASTSTSSYLVLGPSPSSLISTFVKASLTLTLMDSITVLVLLLKTLYA